MRDLHTPFPPKWNNIWVPLDSRSSALAGIAMYAPCTARGEWLQRAAWGLVSVGGPRMLPGRSRPWKPPLPTDEWQELNEELRDITGRFDCYSVYERADGRNGILLLLQDRGRSIALVKARSDDPARLDREERALLLVERARIGSFVAPRVLGRGAVRDWHFLVMTPMPPQMHRVPAPAQLPRIVEEVAVVLTSLERPSGVAPDWVPCHGDFAPWNLRQIGSSIPWLLDWEDVGWAPPGADWTFYRATSLALGCPIGVLAETAATEYWRHEVEQRIEDKVADGSQLNRFDQRLLAALSP